MLKTKNVGNISGTGKRKKIFSQAPCISQAPFHAPIRGGYWGGVRLSKMDCSSGYHTKLAGGPWDAVQNVVEGSRMSKQNPENGFFATSPLRVLVPEHA